MCEFLKDAPRMYVAFVCVWSVAGVRCLWGCRVDVSIPTNLNCLLTSFLPNTYPLLSKTQVSCGLSCLPLGINELKLFFLTSRISFPCPLYPLSYLCAARSFIYSYKKNVSKCGRMSIASLVNM